MDLPETPHLSPPHTLPTCGMYWLCSNSNLGHFTGKFFVAISRITVEGITENWCFGQNEYTEYCQKQNLDVGE